MPVMIAAEASTMAICSAPLAYSKCSSLRLDSSRPSCRRASRAPESCRGCPRASWDPFRIWRPPPSTPRSAFRSPPRLGVGHGGAIDLEDLGGGFGDGRAHFLGLIEIEEIGGLDVLLGRAMLRVLRAGFREREEQREDGDDHRDFLVFGFDGVFERLGHSFPQCGLAAPASAATRSTRPIRGGVKSPRLSFGGHRRPWRAWRRADAACIGSLEPAGAREPRAGRN